MRKTEPAMTLANMRMQAPPAGRVMLAMCYGSWGKGADGRAALAQLQREHGRALHTRRVVLWHAPSDIWIDEYGSAHWASINDAKPEIVGVYDPPPGGVSRLGGKVTP